MPNACSWVSCDFEGDIDTGSCNQLGRVGGDGGLALLESFFERQGCCAIVLFLWEASLLECVESTFRGKVSNGC